MNHKIIVESFNDRAIYSHILNKHCTSKADIETISDSPEWLELGGLSEAALVIKLKDIKSDIYKAPETLKIGIIVDIDNETSEDRISLLNRACSSAFGININITSINSFKKFIIYDENEDEFDFELSYYLSGFNGKGELEHLLKEIADKSASHHANCLETGWKLCLESKGISVDDKQLRKLWMDFYKRLDCLTKTEQRKAQENVQWHNFLNLHPEKFDFSRNIPELNELRSFLTFFC